MNRSSILGPLSMLSALSELRVPARPRHAEYERSQRSLPVIGILQPALVSGLLRTEEVLVDLLPRRAHCARAASTSSTRIWARSALSTSLSSGSTQGALQALASFLVQNGQGTGSLVDVTA